MTTQSAFPLVIDGHNDTLLNLHETSRGCGRSFFEHSSIGHIDLPRARAGGLGGGFFAIFSPSPPTKLTVTDAGYNVSYPPPIDITEAQQITLALMARLFRLERESHGQFAVVRTACQLTECLQKGVLAAILHIEGADAIDPDLNALEVFYQAGLRSLGPVWSRPNIFGYGVPFRYPSSPDTGPGLTDAGRRLVYACTNDGILIDLSHLNEQGFWDVARLSDAPLVATHTAAHTICPSTRNLTDKQLDAIKESDGLVGLNFEVSTLRADGHDDPNILLDTVIRQIDYLVDRVGIDHVGFGSDFDGATMPLAIGDVSSLPNLLNALRTHGYDIPSLTKLAHENWIRVLRQTWHS